MVKIGQKRPKMAKMGQKWAKKGQKGPKVPLLAPFFQLPAATTFSICKYMGPNFTRESPGVGDAFAGSFGPKIDTRVIQGETRRNILAFLGYPQQNHPHYERHAL